MKICGILIFISTIGILITSSLELPLNDADNSSCTSDVECSNSSKCYGGYCVDSCYLENKVLGLIKCAKNSFCVIHTAHRAECECNNGFHGDPYEMGCEM